MKIKYIDAEKLKAEIERRKDIYIGHALCLKETNLIDGFDEALNIIESLQQEQPEVDLEKEIDKAMESDLCPEEISGYDFCCIAHHFFELGLNARK